MSKSTLRLLVISDLHAIMDHENQSDSFLIFDSSGKSSFFEGFKSFILNSNLKPDVIVCSGDVANKASQQAFEKIWQSLNEMSTELSVDLLCVPGNHDLDSRLVAERSFDPKYNLQFVSPPFPDKCFNNNTQFWAWHWYHYRGDLFNAILINTSAYHGFSDEFSRGRIAPKVSEQIEEYIGSDQFEDKPINIVVCHHHPTRMEHVELGSDYEAIDGGELFLDTLAKSEKGPWVIFHGHKHWPQIRNYGDANSTLIVSSGSLSAHIHEEIAKKVYNTFCLVELDLVRTENTGSPSGKYRTYEWFHGFGWRPSTNQRMPQLGGFGSFEPPRVLARKIREALVSGGASFISFSELGELKEELIYCSPDKVARLISELRTLGIEVSLDSQGGFDQFGEAK